MVLLYLLVLWLAALSAAVVGALLAHSASKTRFRRQLDSEQAKWHLRHQQDSPGTVIENISLGWLNLVLQSLWVPVLEKHVAGLTAELLQKVFVEVLEKNAQKSPWKFLDSIEIERLSFGLVPPAFQVASAKFDPTVSTLTLSMDVRFTSNSAQAVLLVRSKSVAGLAPLTVRLEVTHVKLRGRLRLGLVLGQEPPGIQGVYYSFTSPPNLDVAVRPLGLPLPSVVPGVDTALRGVLSKLIGRRMVEPQRRYLDVHRIYLNKHIARVGGPGGLLRIMVLNASNLCPPGQQQQQAAAAAAAAVGAGSSSDGLRTNSKSSGKGASASKPGTIKLSSYCELKFGSLVLRTPIAHHAAAANADWNWQFSIALPFGLDAWPAAAAVGGSSSSAAAGGPTAAAAARSNAASRRGSAGSSDGSDDLYLSVYDAQTVGQPVLLGKTKVSLCPLQLQPNGSARTLVLPLHKASNNRAAVQLSAQWLKSTKQQSARPQQQQERARAMQQGTRISVLPGSLGKQQPPQVQPPAQPSPEQLPRSVSAFAEPSKAVSWQDKTQLRVKSATAAARKSLKSFVGSSSASGPDNLQRGTASQTGSGKLQHAADAVAAESSPKAASIATADAVAGIATGHQQGGGPWSTPAAAASAGRLSSGSATAVDEKAHQSPAVSGSAGAGAADAQHEAAAPYLDVPAEAHSWLSAYGWKGLGSWLWPESPVQAAPSAASVATPQGSMHHHGTSVSSSSPWATAAGEEEQQEDEEWFGMESAASGVSTSSSSPLALLSHVVHMQKELEQQRAQLAAMQQQLNHSSNSYQRLKQVCRQRGRAALLQGACFLLHKADGSTQHVLLYLTHSGSSRGGQPSRLGRQQQPESGITLVLAALPETRGEARVAYRRMAAGTADAAGAAGAGDASSHSAHSAAGAAAGSTAGGVGLGSTPPTPTGRLLGSVGAGIRLRMQRGTMLQLGYDSGKFPRSALQVLKAVPANQLVGVVRGSTHFASPANGSSSAGGGLAGSAAECFTLMVQEDNSGYVTAINLQLPPVGNGRNLDEWILAVRDVAAAVQPAAAGPAVVTVPATQAAVAAVASQAADAYAGAQAQPLHIAVAERLEQGEVLSAGPATTVAGAGAVPVASTGDGVDSMLQLGQAPEGSEPVAAPHKVVAHAVASADAGGTAAFDSSASPGALTDSPVYREDSNAHHALEARDWLLPAAASATPKPFAPQPSAAVSIGGASRDSSSEDDTDTDDV